MRFDFNHLAALSAVLRNGTFDMAAAELRVTPSAISQRIKALEDRVGTALIRRGSPCQATRAGARLAKHAEDVGLLEAQVTRDLSLEQSEGSTVLRIAVNADSLATWFVHAMAAVPGVLFDLVIDDQDHSADWLREGAVSAAITSHGKPVSGFDCHALGSLRYIATASPSFKSKWFERGVTAEALGRAPCLTFNAKDGLQRLWMQQAIGARISPPCHMLPSTHAFIDAAQCGLGWGMNPEMLIRGTIRNQQLVPLIENQPLDVSLNWQVSRVLAGALAPLTRAVRQTARERLRLETPV